MEITHFERMSLNGLCSNSLILNRGQAFRGREGISLSVHACHHTFAYTLLFFSNSFFFFFLSFLLPFLSFSYSLVGLLCSLLLFSPVVPFFLLFSLYTADGPFILPIVKSIYYFTPELLLSGCGCPSRPPTGLSAAQPPSLTCAGRAISHYQTKSLILFACSSCHFYPNKGGNSLLLSLMTCT